MVPSLYEPFDSFTFYRLHISLGMDCFSPPACSDASLWLAATKPPDEYSTTETVFESPDDAWSANHRPAQGRYCAPHHAWVRLASTFRGLDQVTNLRDRHKTQPADLHVSMMLTQWTVSRLEHNRTTKTSMHMRLRVSWSSIDNIHAVR